MESGESINPRELFISYEPVRSSVIGTDGEGLITGYRATLCTLAGESHHRVLFRTSEGTLWDNPHIAMNELGRELPVIGCRYDPNCWRYLPKEIQPSSLDPSKKQTSIIWYPFFEKYKAHRDKQAKVSKARLRYILDVKTRRNKR